MPSCAARLAPYAAAKDGVTRRIKDLGEARDRLAAEMEALQQTPQGSLGARVQTFADDKNKLNAGLTSLELQFSSLATLRKDVEALAGNFGRALDLLGVADGGMLDTGARIETVSEFIKATQGRFDEIERTMATFGQLKGRLGDLQSRLAPLEAKDGGIADLIAQVQDLRDRLIAKIGLLEADENGGLGRARQYFRRVQARTRTARVHRNRAIFQAGDDPQRHRRPVRQTVERRRHELTRVRTARVVTMGPGRDIC